MIYTLEQLKKDYESTASRTPAVKSCILTVKPLSQYRSLKPDEDDCWQITLTYCGTAGKPLDAIPPSIVLADSIDEALSELLNGENTINFSAKQEQSDWQALMQAIITPLKNVLNKALQKVKSENIKEMTIEGIVSYRTQPHTRILLCKLEELLKQGAMLNKADFGSYFENYIICELLADDATIIQCDFVRLDKQLTELLQKNNNMLFIED